MSYIIKKNEPLVNLKLTDLGRRNLSNGALTFKFYGLGDSEMNYTTENVTNQYVFRPVDKNPAIQYPLAKSGSQYINEIDALHSIPTIISRASDSRGFFNNDTEFDMSLTKLSDLYIDSSAFDGTNILVSEIYPNTTVQSGATVNQGDYILVKIIKPHHSETSTIGSVDSEPIMYIWYIVNGVSRNEDTYTLTLDRELPDYTSISGTTISLAYVYEGGNVVSNFDTDTPTAYWDEGLLDFTSNCTNSPDDVPIWNFNVYNYINNVGVNSITDKGKEATAGELFSGAYTYFRYIEERELYKVGIIHYTNNTVSNFYGEGFADGSLELNLPTLMWHKKVFTGTSTANNIGYKFVCDTEIKILGDEIRYYDLIDQEDIPTSVGKVFIDQKVIVIEDAELIAAMSLKSNRNFTLPTPKIELIETGLCNEASNLGSIKPGESIHVTYMFGDQTHNLWYQPCEDVSTLTIEEDVEGAKAQDVMFRFDNGESSSFSYLFNSSSSYGYNVDTILILTQVTDAGDLPESDKWTYFNANGYVGTNGCVSNSIDLCTTDDYELFTESIVVTNDTITNYLLTKTPVGDVLVSVNGVIQTEATGSSYIMYELPTTHPDYAAFKDDIGDYVFLTATNEIFVGLDPTNNTIPPAASGTKLAVGDVIQAHYLIGTSISGSAIQQNVTTPTTIPTTTSGELYYDGGVIYLDLNEDPKGTVYLMYNGTILSSSNYNVVAGGGNSYRVELTFTPTTGSVIALFYISDTGNAVVADTNMISTAIAELTVNISYDTINAISTNLFNLSDFITIPTAITTGDFTFGDENFFFGDINTDIRATIYKTLFTIHVLPDTFKTSLNPTFNENNDKVKITEVGIYDDDNDLVMIGKFSEPLTRGGYTDMLIIQASIDF